MKARQRQRAARWGRPKFPPREADELLLECSKDTGPKANELSPLIIVRFNRDPLMSALSQSPPNEITWDRTLFSPLIAYVATPLIGLIAINFPAVSHVLFGWWDNLQRLLQG